MVALCKELPAMSTLVTEVADSSATTVIKRCWRALLHSVAFSPVISRTLILTGSRLQSGQHNG